MEKAAGETEYSLRILPIGGYCAMAGEDEAMDDPRAFTSQAPWRRIIILVAGAAMNFLIGLVLIFVVFCRRTGVSRRDRDLNFRRLPLRGALTFMVGDVIYRIDGERIYLRSDIPTIMGLGGTARRRTSSSSATAKSWTWTTSDLADEDEGARAAYSALPTAAWWRRRRCCG